MSMAMIKVKMKDEYGKWLSSMGSGLLVVSRRRWSSRLHLPVIQIRFGQPLDFHASTLSSGSYSVRSLFAELPWTFIRP